MYDPAMRVLTVLELLQSRESVTGSELARRLEVSPRTVQRYITRLQDLGIPVASKRGVGGAYRLQAGFRLPPLMFSPEEALALGLGLRALRQLGLQALAPAAEAASAKLSRTMPQSLREGMQALDSGLQFDASRFVVNTDAELVALLLRAVQASQVVRFEYCSLKAEATCREVQVYRLVHQEGRWYAVGWCQLRGALRVFRLDRMRALSITEQIFEPPREFDALALLRSHLPESSAYQVEVWLALPLAEAQARTSSWPLDLSPEGKGTRLCAQREDLRGFAAFLLGLDCDFQVRAPAELREVLERMVRRMKVGG